MEDEKRRQQQQINAQDIFNLINEGLNLGQKVVDTITDKSSGGSGTTSSSSGVNNGLCPEGQRLLEEMQKEIKSNGD